MNNLFRKKRTVYPLNLQMINYEVLIKESKIDAIMIEGVVESVFDEEYLDVKQTYKIWISHSDFLEIGDAIRTAIAKS